MAKNRFNDTDYAISSAGTASLAGGGFYVARNGGISKFNPFGKKRIKVVGGIKPWDPKVRKEAAKIILASSKGLNVDPSLLEAAKKVFQLDSFSAQSLAAADALNDAGMHVSLIRRATNNSKSSITDSLGNKIDVFDPNKFYRSVDLSPAQLSSSDAVLQVGDSANDYAFNAARKRGTKVYRMLTDYGDGNFNQPDLWISGQNWMKVRDPKAYDRLFVPGGSESDLWTELKSGKKPNVNIGDIAVSPIFENMNFKRHAGPAYEAMLTVGGGAGGSISLRNILSNENNRYNFVGKERTLFDDILEGLRAKHGKGNSKLKVFLGSAIQTPQNILNSDGVSFHRGYAPSDVKLSKGLDRLVKLLDPTSDLYKRYAKRAGGLEFLNNLKKRYEGLELIAHPVPQTDIGKAFSSSDYIFTLPGSTTAEFSNIKGNAHGGLIHLIPSEEAWAPKHFRGNALYTNRRMQPGAKHNIVSLVSKNRTSDIAKAITEGGFKEWGRLPVSGNKNALKPMVDTILRDLFKARMLRAGKLGAILTPAALAGTYLTDKHFNSSRLWEKIKSKLT